MSRAFVKEEADGVDKLPDRLISEHPNEVTKEGLQQIEAALRVSQDAYAAAQATASGRYWHAPAETFGTGPHGARRPWWRLSRR